MKKLRGLQVEVKTSREKTLSWGGGLGMDYSGITTQTLGVE